MATQLYNSLTREKEPLPEQKKLRMFVCGPTVYDYLHIGNARTYIFFDLFAQYLRSQGYDVTYLQNITDIDDKIIGRARQEGIEPAKLAHHFTEAYFEDMKALGIDSRITYAPATDFIMQIVGQVERLIDKGFAYKIDGDGWYFDISKDPDYGKLSGRTVEQAEDGVSRIDEASNKRNKGDFCLWKFSKPDEPKWTSALGEGRPGWHIEDTAISEYHFGPQYDIHGGAMDLKFPHHEAEIAQQESASGLKPFVKIWMHAGVLLVDGKKMSKSLDNFITIRDFLKKHPPEILRWVTLTHHYRSPIDYTEASALEARKNINDLSKFIGKLDMAATGYAANAEPDESLAQNPIFAEIAPVLEDDFNTPKAIASIFKTMSQFEPRIWTIGDRESYLTARRLRQCFALSASSLKAQ